MPPPERDRAGRRQWLRRPRLRRRTVRGQRHPALGAEHQRAAVRDRRANDAARRLRHQLAHPEADRGGLRLGQDGGRVAQGLAPRSAQDRLAVHLRYGRLQPGPHPEAPQRRGVTPGERSHGAGR